MSKQAVFTPKRDLEFREENMVELNAADWPVSLIMPAAHEYEAFLQRKVEIAREFVRAGDGLTSDGVESAFAAKRRLAKTA
ncbi:antitoxin of toxin-antitoxin stability system [Pseudomonas sp. SWRI99]|uniref:antitoxin of toxin-antitoxin stability system n=1 Tax=Pseudomonas sp. SWRI99 TaxID=2745506 RepID=UPI00164511E1|nr:antitoxin of toxin-antitoxin stability system [Pseudomonas sp. SWRI99]MBC3779218.1 antitoxin of toxin-antitoxin stability system [Pseudomonas sp. SWRI99]